MSGALHSLEAAKAALGPLQAAHDAALADVVLAEQEVAEARAELDAVGLDEQAAGADAAAAIRAGRRISALPELGGRRSAATSRLTVAQTARGLLEAELDKASRALDEGRRAVTAAVEGVLGQHAAEAARAGAEALLAARRAYWTLEAISRSGVHFPAGVADAYHELAACNGPRTTWPGAKTAAYTRAWSEYRAALAADTAATPPEYPAE